MVSGDYEKDFTEYKRAGRRSNLEQELFFFTASVLVESMPKIIQKSSQKNAPKSSLSNELKRVQSSLWQVLPAASFELISSFSSQYNSIKFTPNSFSKSVKWKSEWKGNEFCKK